MLDKRLDLKITSEQYDFVREQAFKYRCSLAEYIRRVLNYEMQTEHTMTYEEFKKEQNERTSN